MLKKKLLKISFLMALQSLLAVSCEIANDIPFPIVEGEITAFEVEGMCCEDGVGEGKAVIDKNRRTVTLYVDDTVNPKSLKVTRFEVTNDAEIVPVGKSCLNNFPKHSFSQDQGVNATVNFSDPARFILRTYQDYDWTITVNPVIIREVEFEGQVGNAVIDEFDRTVVVYVKPTLDLSSFVVKKFTLGGQHGTVTPAVPADGIMNFEQLPTRFSVRTANSSASSTWSVYVYKTDAKTELTSKVFARTVNATVSGTKPDDEQLLVEYKTADESVWSACPFSSISESGINYTATLTGLKPATQYSLRVSAGDQNLPETSFTTTPALQLDNSSFDDWHLEGSKLYNPWPENGTSFWDTGNRGSTTVGQSITVPSDETSTGSGKSVCMQSKFVVIKFAAGSIFTGSYVRTEGTNGILDFGRPFTAFPSKMTFDYKFKGAIIDRAGSSSYADMKGKPDECQVYIALTDWDAPLQICTNPSKLSLFDKNDPHVIAYAEMIRSADQNEWMTETLALDYNYSDRTPKYILVVCTSSRYGDFFTGGDGSTLCIDNINLVYE